MELFTFGVEHYTEPDVYAAARAFTGWSVVRVTANGSAYWNFNYNAANHDTNAKTFSFDITPGNRTIPARPAASGMQDGIDLINALAIHPETPRRLARRLWTWFVSEVAPPDPGFVDSLSKVYLDNDTEIKPVIRALLFSPHFTNADKLYKRYSWPVEFVVRSLKEVGHVGFSVDTALDAAREHGPVAVRAARRERLGSRAGLVLDGRDARAHELRRDAGAEPAVRAARPEPAAQRESRVAGRFRAREPRDAAARHLRCTRRISTTCAPAASGRDRKRSCSTRPAGSSI